MFRIFSLTKPDVSQTPSKNQDTQHHSNPASGLNRTSGVVRRFARQDRGAVALLFGLALVPLVGILGFSVDYAFAVTERSRLQAAVDSAVLAAGREYQVTGDANAATAKANSYFYGFMADNPHAALVVNSVDPDTNELQLSATSYITTSFLAVLGHKKIDVDTSASATLAQGGLDKDLEVSLMLDVTGSMSGSKIADLKLAAKDLVQILVRDDQSEYTSRVALVPFASAVNPGSLLNLVREPGLPNSKVVDGDTWYLTNCVSERVMSAKYNDRKPIDGRWLGPVYTNNGRCKPSSSAVVPLTSDRQLLDNAIDGMQASGWTAGQIGTAWSWYMLSPKWRSLLPSSQKPGLYNTDERMKIAVLMTDGVYNTQYYQGVDDKYISQNAPNGSSNSQAITLCGNMKNKDIEVYTIGFEITNSTVVNMLETCATDDSHYFAAGNGDELRVAFREIAFRIAQLRLSK